MNTPQSWASEVEQLERERDLLWDALDKITAFRNNGNERASRPAAIAVAALEDLASEQERMKAAG